jgi:chromosome segregation ATPase
MNLSIARNLTTEEAARVLDYSLEPLPEDVLAAIVGTQLASALEQQDELAAIRAQALDVKKMLQALEDARVNVKDQARRLVELHRQLHDANARADSAEQQADELVGDLTQAQREIHNLRAALRDTANCADLLSLALRRPFLTEANPRELTSAEADALETWRGTAAYIAAHITT